MKMSGDLKTKLNVAYSNEQYEKVTLIEPTSSGYIHIAAEVDTRLPFFPASPNKKRLLQKCKRLCKQLEAKKFVQRATLFKAVLIPPGRGKFLKQRPNVHQARFDVSILIELTTGSDVESVRAEPVFAELEMCLKNAAHYVHTINANNIRRIGPVNHERDGVFLFNYFFADDVEQNLAVWEYTAGWFEKETALNNSTLLLPTDESNSEYTVVNHCRWDRLSDILPSILFKRSFRSYVLGNFEANNTAASPILYKLA